jgi:SAM-dependent methyltransferase
MPRFSDSRTYFDSIASRPEPRWIQRAFHSQLTRWFKRRIPENERVLELGCRQGTLLAALSPSSGLGLDKSPRMIEEARRRHADRPSLRFAEIDFESTATREAFDYIVLNYTAGYLSDIQQTLTLLHGAAHPRTRLVITTLNHLWLAPLKWGQWLGLVTPQPPSNWLSTTDLEGLLDLAGWDLIECETIQLCPFHIPLLAPFLNRMVVRLPFFRGLGMTQTFVARPRMPVALPRQLRCSVIVPARNEAGNIRAALDRIPVLGAGTEVVFVEGNSRDDTWEVIQREVARYSGPHVVRAIQQPGKGKWDAVRAGFEIAQGEVLVIQDADLTAPPEDLPKFFEVITTGAAEFANGSRLVYPMDERAMRLLNFFGNKFFATALSYVLGQPVKDSLCGTKMLLRSDYERLRMRIAELGDFDPFGDFNLLFGASLMRLKIRDVPVRYKERTYGDTNISRFSHGWLLLKMTAFGLLHIKWK